MNDSEFDEFIRRKFREGAPEIPESYYQKVDEILAGLSEDDPKKKPVFRPKVAAILAVVFVVGATSAFAGVRVYQERLQSMSESEKKVIDDGVQESEMDIDHYSRELTPSESRRLEDLEKAYRNGVFPQYEMQKIVEVSDVDKKDDALKYCYENSTFYLPDSEMTDEELLEIIDFRYKREYAVDEKNDQDESTPDENMITEAEAVDLSKKYAKQLFHVTVDDKADVTVEYDEGSKISQYYIIMQKASWNYDINVDINPKNGKWSSVLLKYKDKNEFTKGLKVKEDEYVAFQKEIWECVDSICDRNDVEKITLTYNYTKKTNELYSGEVKYVVELVDKKGYIFQRYVVQNQIYSGDSWKIKKYWINENKKVESMKLKGVDVRQKRLILYQK